MEKLNSGNKICLYLDQFVVSNLVDVPNNSLWSQVKELIENLYEENKIYCPLSVEHLLETSRKNIVNSKVHHSYFSLLSDGYFYKNELFLTSQLISSRIRNNNITINTILKKVPIKKMEAMYASLNEKYDVFSKSIEYDTSGVNEFRKIRNIKKTDKSNRDLFINAIKNVEVTNFVDRLKDLLNNGKTEIRADNYGEINCPNWIDAINFQLLNKHKFNRKEIKKLIDEFERHGFSKIPTLDVRFTLGSYWAVKGSRELTSDHLDVCRISNGLFGSDIFFTDKKRKNEIIEMGLDVKYKTKVFNGTESDLNEFINFLNTKFHL
ncbi:hypothetical protein [uncultured Flavobacterium sp.]|uniref:hypothetical protein n=1 Tax=uncultured Flavobacterium sp. TaxID=165435 RepID=UPI0025FF00DE|nr:hypothetical protein [uncultured Flavobacterium sp.]